MFDDKQVLNGLSPRQIEVLRCIERHMETRGCPPTVREIGEDVGLRSTSSVANVLRKLELFGYIKRGTGGHAYLVPGGAK